MVIEFTCPSCHSRLRVPDSTAGHTAECPSCSQLVQLPAPETTANVPPPVPITPDALRTTYAHAANPNPYSAPSADPFQVSPATGNLEPRQVTAGQILARTVDVFRENFMQCLLLGLVMIGLSLAFGIAGMPLSMAADAYEDTPMEWVMGLFSSVWSQLAGVVTLIVSVKFALGIVLRSPSPIHGAFELRSCFLPVLGIQILMMILLSATAIVAGLGVGGTFLLSGFNMGGLIVGGILFGIIGVTLWFLIASRVSLAIPLVIHRHTKLVDSVEQSLEFTRGNALAIVLTWVAYFLASIILVVCTLGLALFVILPFSTMLLVVTYLLATGQFESSPHPGTGENPAY